MRKGFENLGALNKKGKKIMQAKNAFGVMSI